MRRCWTWLALLSVMGTACGGSRKGLTEPPPCASEDGWTSFAAGDYNTSKKQFRAAEASGCNVADAHLGLGWSLMYEDSLQAAEVELQGALESGVARSQDALCGLAIVALGMEGFAQALVNADAVLERESQYAFPKRPTVDFKDIHYLRAEAAFHEGYLTKTQESLNVIDPENNLNPSGPSTWIVEGRYHETYVEALVAELERARELASH